MINIVKTIFPFFFKASFAKATSLKPDWYNKKEFSYRLDQEVKRSYRTGSPLTLTSINFKNSEFGNISTDKIIFELISLITVYTREYDLKNFDSGHQIQIVLLDTDFDGANKVVNKLIVNLQDLFFNKFNLKRNLVSKNFYFNIFPLNQIPKSNDDNISKTKQNKIIVEDNKAKGIDKKFSEIVNVKWETINSTGVTLAISYSMHKRMLYKDVSIFIFHFFKRIIDILGSIIGILVFSPIMFLIAIAIKIESKGPIIFKQKRIGFNGVPFTFFKFRSMSKDNDPKEHQEYVKKLIDGNLENLNNCGHEKPVFKITAGPRVTKVGHILRTTSLDELPQFFNVLIGNMSLVGPRPPIGYELENYKSWHLRRILEVKPGITGIWQVDGRSLTTFDDMVRMDLYYAKNQNVMLDIKILFKTIIAVINFKGAY